jgi:adenylate kinase
MKKQVILITGTPKVGKTTTALNLAEQLKAECINLTDLAQKENLILKKDKQRNTTIINEQQLKKRITQLIKTTQNQTIIIDSHYAAAIVPKALATHVFVLRRHPKQLRKLMQQAGYKNNKLHENLTAEILDTCLVEAITHQGKQKACEINTTNKTTQTITNEIIQTLNKKRKCQTGTVDWIAELENEGTLDEYLKF